MRKFTTSDPFSDKEIMRLLRAAYDLPPTSKLAIAARGLGQHQTPLILAGEKKPPKDFTFYIPIQGLQDIHIAFQHVGTLEEARLYLITKHAEIELGTVRRKPINSEKLLCKVSDLKAQLCKGAWAIIPFLLPTSAMWRMQVIVFGTGQPRSKDALPIHITNAEMRNVCHILNQCPLVENVRVNQL